MEFTFGESVVAGGVSKLDTSIFHAMMTELMSKMSDLHEDDSFSHVDVCFGAILGGANIFEEWLNLAAAETDHFSQNDIKNEGDRFRVLLKCFRELMGDDNDEEV